MPPQLVDYVHHFHMDKPHERARVCVLVRWLAAYNERGFHRTLNVF